MEENELADVLYSSSVDGPQQRLRLGNVPRDSDVRDSLGTEPIRDFVKDMDVLVNNKHPHWRLAISFRPTELGGMPLVACRSGD